MKITKQSLLLLPAMVLVGALFAAPVYARDGADDTPSTQESETHAQEVAREAAKDQAERLREQAKQDVEKKRESAKQENEQEREQKKQEREHACESHKHGLETKVGNLNKNGQKHLDHFNKVYANALEFQKTNNLNPAGFADLTAKADAAKAKAEASVAALNALKPTLDCQKDTVASDVSAFKAAAAQARTDLQAYRSSIKDVLKALETAKEATETGQDQ